MIFGSLLFEGTYNALAKDVTHFLSPMSLVILSESLTAFFVIATIGIISLGRELLRANGRELFTAMLIGVLNSALAPYLWFLGLQNTTAVNASILYGSNILFLLAFNYLFLNEKINRVQLQGASIVLAGVLLIATGGGVMSFSAHQGDVLIILANLVFSSGTILFKRHLSHFHPEAALFLRNISGIVTAVFVSALISHPFVEEISGFPIEYVSSLLAFAFFSRFLNLSFFYGALERLPATTCGLIMNAAPLSGMFFAAMLLHEEVYAYHMVGAMLIIFGLMLEQVSRNTLIHAKESILRFRAQQNP
jgi:drug/metabolite transporter (DMT)-like permease